MLSSIVRSITASCSVKNPRSASSNSAVFSFARPRASFASVRGSRRPATFASQTESSVSVFARPGRFFTSRALTSPAVEVLGLEHVVAGGLHHHPLDQQPRSKHLLPNGQCWAHPGYWRTGETTSPNLHRITNRPILGFLTLDRSGESACRWKHDVT